MSREWLMTGLAAMIAAQSMAFGLAINLSPPSGTDRLMLHLGLAVAAVVVFVLAGLPILKSAFRAALSGRIVIEQLFLAGIAGAFGASLHCTLTGHGAVYYEVVAVLVAIYNFGRVLGERRRVGAQEAASRLRGQFATARVVAADGTTASIPVEDVQAGVRARVLSGEGVPVDGHVVLGSSFVRETALTGELFPVVKREGDVVLAGSLLEDGVLEIETSRAGTRRHLDALLGAVAGAAAQPAEIEREADRIVRWFLPAVMIVSVLTFVGWTLAAGWPTALFNALAVLLVACPCAMGLATPIGIWGALNDLAERGVVLKSGRAIETLGSVDTVVFDKTGTLSEERFTVIDTAIGPGFDRAQVRWQVAALQACSTHPVARALAAWAGDAPDGVASDVRAVASTGISGKVRGALIEIGNANLLDAPTHKREAADLRRSLTESGSAAREFYVRVNGKLAVIAVVREQMRNSAAPTVARLGHNGVETWIMTGDPAWSPADFPGVESGRVLTGMTPDAKAEKVRELVTEGRRVLFVGDGVNDAPAMAHSACSLAMGEGADLSRSAASGEIFGGELSRVPVAIDIARRTLRAIRTNFIFAGVYNVAGIALAAAGVLHPVAAALLMLGSSATVTIRALNRSGSGRVREGETTIAAPILPAAVVGAGLSRGMFGSNRMGRILTLGGVFAQGAALPWLAGMSGGAILLGGLVAAACAAVLWLWRPELDGGAGQIVEMAGIGGFAMLAGWWADAGFAAVVRDGVCLCGCARSDLGWGLLMQWRWMDAAMIVAAGLLHWRWGWQPGAALGCIGAMLLGMKLAAVGSALVPVTHAGVQFLLTYFAMLCGMLIGMALVQAGVERRSRHPAPAAARNFSRSPA